ncbi:MAG TPA: hypothetical protein DCM45_05525, partial [Clostridiales bacterium]|nr:hypothetical protein [Clostridiales bacterium]
LFWFNPFWHSSWCCYSKDFIDFKINRIRHKQGLKSGLINNIIISFTGFVTCLALLLVIVFLAWQMPRHILPTVNSSQIAAQADVPVVTRSIPSDRYILTDYRVIYDDTSLISISDSSSRFDSLLRLDSNGDVIWLSSIYSLLDMPVYPSVEMLDTCQIAEDHWTIAVKIGRAQTQVPEIWYICVDGLGKPVSRQIITLPDEYGRLDIDYRVVITLAPDGGWIQSIYSIKNVKSSQTTLPAYTSQNLLNLSRYDAQGQALWSLDPATTDLQDINNSFIMNEKVVKFKRIQQIVPTADGGCAVLTLGQIRLTRFNRETSHEESAFYYDVGQLFIISAAGDITRTQDLIGKAGYFQVFQAFANDDGTLYLIGLDMQPDPGLSALEEISYPAIQAIAADGSIKFSIIAAESGQYNLRGAMMQDQQLTLLLHDVYKGSALYQIDLEGQNRWLDILDPDDGFIPMALVTDDQIVAFSNAISPDEKPGA